MSATIVIMGNASAGLSRPLRLAICACVGVEADVPDMLISIPCIELLAKYMNLLYQNNAAHVYDLLHLRHG